MTAVLDTRLLSKALGQALYSLMSNLCHPLLYQLSVLACLTLAISTPSIRPQYPDPTCTLLSFLCLSYTWSLLCCCKLLLGITRTCFLQISHRDVKSNNVLLSEDFESAKICDVGLARIMGGTSLSSSSHLVHATFAYAAPEILLNKR